MTQRLEKNSHGAVIDVLETRYLDYFSRYFPLIVPISNHTAFPIDEMDYAGIIITGGGDLPNTSYSKNHLSVNKNHLAVKKYDFQSMILKKAVQEKKKIIAICYGLYLVNDSFGGRVTWDVHHQNDHRRPGMHHPIQLNNKHIPQTEAMVNHYHHQGIEIGQLGNGLEIIAWDSDSGLVEACFHNELPILCFQWHPERPSPDSKINHTIVSHFLSGGLSI